MTTAWRTSRSRFAPGFAGQAVCGRPPRLRDARAGSSHPPEGESASIGWPAVQLRSLSTFALLLFAGAVSLLGGCTLRRPEVAPVDWAQRSERLLALENWQARGRIAVKSPNGGGQGDLAWEQHGAAARIRVSGPFGAGAYEIRWDPYKLVVSSRNGEFSRDYTGPDATEQFLTEQLGWSFPATSTRYWLLGLPDPAFAAQPTFAADGRLAALEQNGWSVTYESYTEQAGTPMPAKITLQNARARVRLAIDRWTL